MFQPNSQSRHQSKLELDSQRFLQQHIPIWFIFDSGMKVDVNRDSLPHGNHTDLTLIAKVRGQKQIKKWLKANNRYLPSPAIPHIEIHEKDLKFFGLF